MSVPNRDWLNNSVVKATVIIIKDHKSKTYTYDYIFPEFYDLLDTCKTMGSSSEKSSSRVFDWGLDMKETFENRYTIDDEKRTIKAEEIITDDVKKEEIRRKIYLLFFGNEVEDSSEIEVTVSQREEHNGYLHFISEFH